MINMLRREQKIRNIILFTLFSFLFIGVGYAVISSNLQMNGSMTLNKITWDVHFENFEELYNNTVTGTNSLSNEDTTLTYNVTLNKPGDIYEFTVDIVNNGNIDAMLSSLGNSGLTSAQQEVLDYSVTYLDGSIPTEKDSLKAKEVETLVVSIKTKADITNSKLSATDTNLSLTLSPTYAQDDKTSIIRNNNLGNLNKVLLDNAGGKAYIESKSKPNSTDLATEDEGLYALEDDYGMSYYYRGKVEDNNIIFSNKCWKIIRINGNNTTRLLYNGLPTDGKCNAVKIDSMISALTYNELSDDNAYGGYMYGKANATSLDEAHSNTYESTIKKEVDRWYKENFDNTSFSNYISDTLFCGDRSVQISGEGFAQIHTDYYRARYRYEIGNNLTLKCLNKNDRYTVNDVTLGNGALNYPIALMNSDEAYLAGGSYNNDNSDYYLYNQSSYWLMNPRNYTTYSQEITIFFVEYNGMILNWNPNYSRGVRPVINLKHGVKILGGNGTSESPYIVN